MYTPPIVDGLRPHAIVSPVDRSLFSWPAFLDARGLTQGNSQAWPSAQKPVAVPFYLWQPETIYQLGWLNGSGTMTDNVDVGVYDSSWNRKISTGSTARAGASSLQFVDVADTPLAAPAKYFLVMSDDGTTAGQQNAWFLTSQIVQLADCWDSSTNAFPLPDPLTNMVLAATFVIVPVMFMAFRSVV